MMDPQHMKSLTNEEFIGVVECTMWLHHRDIAGEMVRRLREGDSELRGKISDMENEAYEARRHSETHFEGRRGLEDTLRDVETWIENLPDSVDINASDILKTIATALREHGI